MSKRFWAKVAAGNMCDCWPWTAARSGKGYGRFGVEGKNRHAHRVAYELVFGSIPSGMHVLHRCDNPPCCNPVHLWLGTNADNQADMNAKGRHAYQAGESNGRAKLRWADIPRIKSEVAAGRTRTSVAAEYGVSRPIIGDIINGKGWIR